jgi:glycosyltransferase involved in cell wall biosynthesis
MDIPRSLPSVVYLNSMLSGGGTDDQCVKLAHGLRSLGHQVWLAGPDGREFTGIARELGVPFHATPPEGPLKLRFIRSVAGLIRRERIQIVHGHHGRDLWPTILAARLSRRRPLVVLTRHLAKSPSSWFSRWFLLGRCDALIAVSEFVAKVLREGVYEPASPEPERRARPRMLGDYSKIRVIRGGIDTDRFRPLDAHAQRQLWGLGPEHIAFGIVGSYTLPRGKGHREFLQAAAQIASQVPQARFVIVGRGDLAPTLRSDIERLNLVGKAWMTPYSQDMVIAMNALDCLVHPQVGTEAFPGVVLEAFACGKPVIASALDGIPEGFAVGGCGKLVPPEDIAALASAMLEQARQPALTEANRQALHQRVAAEHSLPVWTQKVSALYQQLVA